MPSYKGQNGISYAPSNYTTNLYDDFMKKHLSHYGYYTGRNADYNKKSFLFNDFNKTHGYQVSSSSSEDDEKKLEETQEKSKQLEYRFEAGRLVSRLKEPRQLFAIANPSLGPQQLARWPAELEVAIEKLKHLFNSPKLAEPFYMRTGNEEQPQLVSLEQGTTVFQLQNNNHPFFIHSRVGGSRDELHAVSKELNGPGDTTLVFESRFESGNLARAVQTGPFSYELWLRNDLYTNKHTQWFYFQIKNTRRGQKYRFTICNFMKSNSLYNYGMKPCYYSEKEERSMGLGWRRKGDNIVYYKSNYTYPSGKSDRPYYALTFTQTFTEDDDTVYLSHCYPYTYTDLQDYLKEVVDDEQRSKYCKLRVLTRSLAGNLVYLLTITSPQEDGPTSSMKRAVVITARVHPGETNGSWMMKGLLDYILGDSEDAKLLRDTFIFKIIPMLNPDGVIVGNYRCSLAGRDLNRNYKSQLADSYPTIMAAKAMIKKVLMEREVVVYCDLHGHSRKQNVFIYGCENRNNRSKRLHERVFPAMLSKNCPEKFVFDECNFKVQKGKEGTGRIVMWNMGIMNSFTMEATFCGSVVGSRKSSHFSIADFESMGYHFCDTLLDYCDPDKSKYNMVMRELEATLKSQILSKFAKLGKTNVMVNGRSVNLTDPDLDIDELLASGIDLSDDDGGSDSSVSDGLPVNIEYMQSKADAQRKKKLTKKQRDKLKQTPSQDSLPVNQKTSKPNRPPTASAAKVNRVCSAKDRHEKCYHSQTSGKPALRRCLSARHLQEVPSSGSSDRTVPFRDDVERSESLVVNGAGYTYEAEDELEESNQRAYLASINKVLTTPDPSPHKLPSANPLKPITGHLRYSNSVNKPLAMNLDELTVHQPENSVSAQYLLTRVKESSFSPGPNDNIPGMLPIAENHGTDSSRSPVRPVLDGSTPSLPKSISSKNRSYSSNSSQPREGDKEGRQLLAYTKHQAVKQVNMSSALEKSVMKQHPLPFEKVTKPGVASKVFVFGQGAVETGPVPKPHYSARPERQRMKGRRRESSSTDELRKQVDSQLDDIEELKESIQTELRDADPDRVSHASEMSRKYLEQIMQETDRDIEKLRVELTELSSESKQAGKNSILEMVARQRHLPSSTSPGVRLAAADRYNSTGKLNRTGGSHSAPTKARKIYQELRPTDQAGNELLQVTSKVSVHMSNHSVPSAPKASRRVQVRIVPTSRQQATKRY